jgi:capsular polysaccharide biosynthesis protein
VNGEKRNVRGETCLKAGDKRQTINHKLETCNLKPATCNLFSSFFSSKKINVGKQITKDDIRFVEFWKEQRQGSKVKYYALYTIAWGFMVCLFSFFTIIFLGGISIIPIPQDNQKIAAIILVGLVIGFFTAFINRWLNERRYQRILEKVRNN